MKKQPAGTVPFVIGLLVTGGLWSSAEESFEWLSRVRSIRGLRMFATMYPERLVILAVWMIAVLCTVLSFVRIVKSGGKAAAPKRSANTPAAPVSKSAAPRTFTRHAPSVKMHQEADEAIHCAHLRGREKYLEQIEGFLRTGLIDRNEYRVLKERYSKLDIPDDYH